MKPHSRIIGAVLVIGSVLALVMSVATGIRGQAYARCQSAVTDQLVRSQDAQARAEAQDRQIDREESVATAALINAVFTLPTSADRLAAYATYRKTLEDLAERRAATEEQRRANPLPAPPSETC